MVIIKEAVSIKEAVDRGEVEDPVALVEMGQSMARRDLNLVRKKGVLTVTRTLLGNLDVFYNDGEYKIVVLGGWDFETNQPTTGYELYKGRRKGAAEALFNSYAVTL